LRSVQRRAVEFKVTWSIEFWDSQDYKEKHILGLSGELKSSFQDELKEES